VAVCGRAGGAALRDAPGRSQTLTDRAGSEESVGLGRGTDSLQSRIWNLHEPAARLDRVDDRAANEKEGGARLRHERRRDEAAGRRLGDAERFASLLQARGDLLGDR